jgi:membrane protein required for beta-lactamase induction
MNLVALLLGLAIERLLTHLFHLREFHWLDPLFDAGFHRLSGQSPGLRLFALIALAAAVVLPVAILSAILSDALFHVPHFAFAVLVLLFSLGPRDLKEEVDDYCAASAADNPEELQRAARELLEAEPPAEPAERAREVERAILVQANNRIFGVVFWFLLLGPTGAWLFRVLDLMRHRLAGLSMDESGQWWGIESDVRALHGFFAWIPARLLAAAYALGGSFDDAFREWRAYTRPSGARFFDVSEGVLHSAGCGALTRSSDEATATESGRVAAAMDLVIRALWLIWCPVIAILTLYELVS